VHTGGDAVQMNRELGAQAFAHGSDVYFGAGKSPGNNELTAHELTHVVQQTGGVQRLLRDSIQNQCEACEADEKELQTEQKIQTKSTLGAVSQSLSERSINHLQLPVIQRYELEGPWNKNNPVHEVLTLMSIKEALQKSKNDNKKTGTLLRDVNTSSFPEYSDKNGHNIAPEKIDPSAQQFIRGVIWPDDPKGYLFDDPKGTTNYSSGLMWWEEFDPDEKDEPEELIARSHYGDLQFFHAMASKDNEDPKVTKEKIMQWSRFLTEVSTGQLAPETKLKDHRLTKKLFPAHQDYTIKKLFGYEKATNQEVRQRAAGALMHLIQDSNAAGHVGRNKKTGDIQQFRSYEHQDHGKHGEKDAWVKGKNLSERIKNTPGAENAINQCTQILLMLDQGASTEEVIKYLDEQIFKLSPNAEKSGPGEEYKDE
jgi:hypothetical protein